MHLGDAVSASAPGAALALSPEPSSPVTGSVAVSWQRRTRRKHRAHVWYAPAAAPKGRMRSISVVLVHISV
jgi:hypothetical protein